MEEKFCPCGKQIKKGKYCNRICFHQYHVQPPVSNETRELMRQKKLNRKLTQEHKDKIANANRDKPIGKGRHLSEEHKKNVGKSLKGRPSPTKGMHHSEETKRKIGEKSAQQVFSLEQREKKKQDVLKQKLEGRGWFSKEAKEKRSISQKKKWQEMTEEEKYLIMKGAHEKITYTSSIERFVMNSLDNLKIKYKHHKYIRPYSVDFFLEDLSIIIECHGCYWHGCELCNFNNPIQTEKRGKDNDRENKLREMGYKIILLYEHDIRYYKKVGLLDKLVFERIYRPTIHEYYIEMSEIVAKRSTCKKIRVGSIIVKNDQICSTGYNGSPSGMPHCIDHECIIVNDHCIASIHAETNALIQAGKDTFGSDLYTTHLCCIDCCKLVINCGIKRLFYLNDYIDDRIELFGFKSQIDYLQKAGIFVENVVPRYYQLKEKLNADLEGEETDASNS